MAEIASHTGNIVFDARGCRRAGELNVKYSGGLRPRPSRLLTKRLHAAMSDSSATVPRLAGNIMGARVGALESDGSRALYKKRWRQLSPKLRT